MATDESKQASSSLMTEKRTFAPSADFAAKANIKSFA